MQTLVPLSAKDEKDLRTLVICHYVLAALTAAIAALGIPLVSAGLGLMGRSRGGAQWPSWLEMLRDLPGFEDPAILGRIILALGASVIALSLVHGLVIAWVGSLIAKRKRPILIIAFEAMDLAHIPLGTVLGIWTIVVLSRASVRQAFAGGPRRDCG